jgi:cobalt-zinc-cadmium efflux system outer membrane protein
LREQTFIKRGRSHSLGLLIILLIFVAGNLHAMDKREATQVIDSIENAYSQSKIGGHAIDSNFTLEDYLQIALANNPGLKSSFYRWKADLEKTGYAGALPDPMFSYGYFGQSVETRVGPQNQRFSIKQTLPWFGTLGAKKAMALAGANASYRQYQSEKLRLYYNVKAAYYDLYYLGREIQLTSENMELMKFWESVARAKYTVGQARHPDVIKAQVELGKLDDQLKSLQDMVNPARARLLAALNLEDSISLPIPDSIEVEEISLGRDSVISMALDNNPDLDAIRNMIEKDKQGVRLAGKSSYPNFTFGLDYIQTGEALNPALEDSGKDPWIVSVGINLPLWFGKNKAIKEEARARFISSQRKLDEAKNQLTSMMDKVIFDFNDALRKIKLYRDGLIPKAEQSLNATFASYQSGESDFLNVLDAQRQLLEFQLQYDRARTNFAKKRAEIEYLTGNEFKPE